MKSRGEKEVTEAVERGRGSYMNMRGAELVREVNKGSFSQRKK